jgi:hypothetical protein
VGLVFLWAVVIGVLTKFFLNMEIERYTLATGETAITGFSRFWKPWGIVFCLCMIHLECLARRGDERCYGADLHARLR